MCKPGDDTMQEDNRSGRIWITKRDQHVVMASAQDQRKGHTVK
jgi:hypothetical protein